MMGQPKMLVERVVDCATETTFQLLRAIPTLSSLVLAVQEVTAPLR